MAYSKLYENNIPEMLSNIVKIALIVSVLAFMQLLACSFTYAADDGIPDGYTPPHYHDIKPYLMRNLFETDYVYARGIEVKPDNFSAAYTNGVTFRVFNSTAQETEGVVKALYDDESGYFLLPDLKLKKLHNYILFTEDRYYQRGTSIYAQALPAGHVEAKAGEGLYTFKNDENYSYKKLDAITVFKRSAEAENTQDYTRCGLSEVNEEGDAIKGLPVVYNGKPVSGVKVSMVSSVETIDAVSDEDGRLYADLLEDIQYMVYVSDDRYDMEPFPLSIKDKSEYGAGRYPYDHSTCHRVDRLQLIDKGSINLYDAAHSITSLDKTASVSGMKFGDMLLISRRPDIPEYRNIAGSRSYTVELTAMNPHRWEISRLEGHNFNVIINVDADKKAVKVYAEVQDGSGNTDLQAIPFSELPNNRIKFTTDNISQTIFVVGYEARKITPEVKPLKPKATFIKKLTRKKKAVTLTWQKRIAGTSGYQIQLSSSKSFKKGKRTITVKKASSTKKTIRKLKKGKKYYVRIRTYLDTPSGRIYSSWSKRKVFRSK